MVTLYFCNVETEIYRPGARWLDNEPNSWQMNSRGVCVLSYLEDGSGGLQLVASKMAEYEEGDDVADDTEQHNRRRQPDFDDVPQQFDARVVVVLMHRSSRPVPSHLCRRLRRPAPVAVAGRVVVVREFVHCRFADLKSQRWCVNFSVN